MAISRITRSSGTKSGPQTPGRLRPLQKRDQAPVGLGPAIHTTGPTRRLRLVPADGAIRIDPDDEAAPAPLVELPAEAFVRLVYGRLDGDHPPRVGTSPFSPWCGQRCRGRDAVVEQAAADEAIGGHVRAPGPPRRLVEMVD